MDQNSVFSFLNFYPSIGESVFIASGAKVIGRSTIGDNVNIWFNAIIRGDVAKISVGNNSNVQDLSMLHVTDDLPLVIGSNVTIGHSVTLHSCHIEDSVLIGMGSTILDNAVIGSNSLVAAGSLVTPGKKFPGGVMIAGSPAKIIRDLTAEELKQYANHYKSYLLLKDQYLQNEQ